MRWQAALCAAAVLLACLGGVAVASQAPSPPLSNAVPLIEELGRQVQDPRLPESDRLELIRTLGKWGTPQVREPLVAALDDQIPSIRQAAASALGWPGNREAAAALRRRVETPGEASIVRVAALESLGKIGVDSVRDAVLAAASDPDARVREAALGAVALGLLAKPTDSISLLRRLAEDRALDPWLRCEAIRELAKAQDSASGPLLKRLLETDPPTPMPLPRDDANQQEVMVIRFRQARDVRAWAAAALGQLEARDALPLLLRSAEDRDDFFLRITSMRVLVAWKAREALPVFLQRAGDPFPDVRALAVTGLARAGNASVADEVVARLSDPVAGVRIAAIGALADLGHTRARPALESLRKHEIDSAVQQAIEAALERLGP